MGIKLTGINKVSQNTTLKYVYFSHIVAPSFWSSEWSSSVLLIHLQTQVLPLTPILLFYPPLGHWLHSLSQSWVTGTTGNQLTGMETKYWLRQRDYLLRKWPISYTHHFHSHVDPNIFTCFKAHDKTAIPWPLWC